MKSRRTALNRPSGSAGRWKTFLRSCTWIRGGDAVGSSGPRFGFTTRTLASDRHVSLPARIQPVHGVMPDLRPVMRNPTQATDRSALAGREGQEFSPPRIQPELPLIPRSSVFLQEAGGALRNLHTNSSRKSSDQQVGKFIRPPLWHKESRHQDQRIGDPEPHGVFTVS